LAIIIKVGRFVKNSVVLSVSQFDIKLVCW
jgi:hypothetical protein